MSVVKSGDTIKVNYVGTLDDGSVFDSSEGREPLEFTVGGGQVIKGFDDAVEGMDIGNTVNVHIPSEEAYGPRQDELMFNFPKERFPDGFEFTVGAQIHLQDQEGNPVPVTITGSTEEEVSLDANHPMAGKDLNFEITLIDII